MHSLMGLGAESEILGLEFPAAIGIGDPGKEQIPWGAVES